MDSIWRKLFFDLAIRFIMLGGAAVILAHVIAHECGYEIETFEETWERKREEREQRKIMAARYKREYSHVDMSKETIDYNLRKDFFFQRLYKKGGGEYDAAFYFIGQFDYDPFDREMVDAVVDLVLMKTLSRHRLPYIPELSKEELEGKLFRYEKGANHPESIRHLVEAREAQEEFFRQKGQIYVPDGNEFASDVASRANAMTEQTYAKLEKQRMEPPKERVFAECWQALVDQWIGFSWWERLGCVFLVYLSLLMSGNR